MNRFALVAVVSLAACGSPATVAKVVPSAPSPVPASQPAPASVPVVSPPAVPAGPSSAPVHVKVVIPASTGYVIAADQRFAKDLVAGQPVLVNAICDDTLPFPFDRTYVAKGDGLFLDMMSCKKVGQAVVDEWFYAWNKIAQANPSFTPKQIQDAISAGQY